MKTVQTKKNNGSQIPNTLESGKIIRRVVLESNITEIQINMKEDGKLAWEMDKEHIGYLKAKINWEENTPGIGKMIKKLVEALCFIKMGIVMMVYGKNYIILLGWMINLMVREE